MFAYIMISGLLIWAGFTFGYRRGLKHWEANNSTPISAITKGLQSYDLYPDEEEEQTFHPQSCEALEHIKGLIYEISYKDARGIPTTRIVSITEVSDMLYAYCYLRQAPRTFRLDRIVSAYSKTTGEVFESAQKFLGHLRDENNKINSLLHKYQDILNVLVAIARADRRFHASEKRTIFTQLKDCTAFPDNQREWLYDYLENLRPSPDVFKNSLETIQTNPSLIEHVKNMAHEVANADGAITKKEIELINEVCRAKILC